jgi:uncharacterized membrane protein
MTVKHMAIATIAAVALATVTAPAASAATATCTASYLPMPAGWPDGSVTAADSGGGYAGYSFLYLGHVSWTTHALRWSNGQVTDLGTLAGDGNNVTVTGVNKQGTVVGSAAKKSFRSRNGKLEALPMPADVSFARAEGINDNGDIVGDLVTSRPGGDYTRVPVLWPADGSAPVKLTGLPTTGQTSVKAIDQDGTVLIEYYPTSDGVSATALYLWKAGIARKLANPADTTTVRGLALSNGRVVGQTYPASGIDGRGVLWDQNGVPSRPPTSEGLSSINRSGQAVGYSLGTPGAYGVWQLNTLTATIPSQHRVEVSADDGTIGGHSQIGGSGPSVPTVWRCG